MHKILWGYYSLHAEDCYAHFGYEAHIISAAELSSLLPVSFAVPGNVPENPNIWYHGVASGRVDCSHAVVYDN